MGPRVDSVPSDDTLPARVDVVVIGGGIIGTSTALFLARKGVSVALCEKGCIAHEQSSRNWGGAEKWRAIRANCRWPSRVCASGSA
jgi:glycine/D-amino acid oxidase-like deaminating enzyme